MNLKYDGPVDGTSSKVHAMDGDDVNGDNHRQKSLQHATRNRDFACQPDLMDGESLCAKIHTTVRSAKIDSIHKRG